MMDGRGAGRKVVATFLMLLLSVVLIGGAQADGEDNRLDPESIPKYVIPLVIPPEMPYVSRSGNVTEYHIAVKQFSEQILPEGFPTTTVWGYGDADGPEPGLSGSTYNYPAFTVETRSDATVRVKWINGLVDGAGNYLPHLLPVDPTLMWANPPGPPDSRPQFISTPGPYTGPVPIVTHVHGAHVPSVSDGNPLSWYLPDANNIPATYYRRGSYYNTVAPAEPGTAWFEYPNSQRAATIWYHDHAMGMTRLNVYAGLAGFWLIRDDYEDSLNLPGPAPHLHDAPGTRYYEIPIAVQDKSFNSDGSLFYPDGRSFFGDFEGPFIPDTNVSPIWIPEFFGDTIVVNGKTWPYLNVEPRKYRLRLLNGCNARTLILKIVGDAAASRPADAAVSFNQVGNDGGIIPGGPVSLDRLIMAPAERSDVVIDFSMFAPGTELYLINEGPDEPYGSEPYTPAAVDTTGQVMKFKIVASTGSDTSTLPAPGTLSPVLEPLGPVVKTRDLIMKETAKQPEDAPAEVHLGTAEGGPFNFMDEVTETPNLNDTEMWRLINLTVDAHPIHLHLVTFEVVGRLPINADAYAAAEQEHLNDRSLPAPDPADYATGPMVGPNSWEGGRKDTVIALPGYVTIVKQKFDMPGLYVWHCHIIEHEDNEMMRPFLVQEGQCATFDSVTSTLHVPCLDLGDLYWLDMTLTNNDPIQFSLANIGLNDSTGGGQCATLNLVSSTLHIPCLDLGTHYSADFALTGSVFELVSYQVIQ